MIQFKIYNDDKIRHWANFPTLKDPYVLENTLLRIINELFSSIGLPMEKEFNILNPRLANLYFVYYTSSNFQAWGELPFGYIYNDMVRHIQNRNTSNNFIMTLESIFIDNTNSQSSYDFNDDIIQPSNSLAYEIVSSYISENYLNSYNYIVNNNNGIMVAMIPTINGTMCYIIAVGFDPLSMSKWFCTKDNLNDVNSLPFARYMSLRSIVSVKLGGFNRVPSSNGLDLAIDVECSDSRVRENINYCVNMLNGYDISALKKKSIYDTEVKYGNFPIDYNWLSIYDMAVPAAYHNYTDRKQEKFLLTKFNQPCDYRVDYRILKRQNDLIKIAEKRKAIGVGS